MPKCQKEKRTQAVLGSSHINRNSAVPAYFQILHQLKGMIDKGQLKADDLLPSEQELADLFEVNKLTIRRAIQELVFEGRVIRRQGRRSQVAGPKIMLDPCGSFADQLDRLGMQHDTQILSSKLVKTPDVVQRRGGFDEDGKMLHILRVRRIEESSVAVEDNYFVERFAAPYIEDESRANRLYSSFRSVHGMAEWGVDVEIELVSASSEDAMRLDTREGRPMLTLRQLLVRGDEPFGYTYVRFLAERFHFHLGLQKYPVAG